MQIINALAFSAALVALTSSVAVRGDAATKKLLDLENEPKNGPHDFDQLDAATKGRGKGKAMAQGGFALRGAGGRLRLCPTGDCKASVIDISMHHLQEMLADGTTATANKINNFDSLTYTWATPVTTLSSEGVNVTTSRFTASLPIEGVNTPVNYTAEVAFYDGNGTTKHGEQIIDVPAGGLKFAVWIDSWPFLQPTNKLHLGLRIMSMNKQGGMKPDGTKHSGQGRDKKIDRVVLMNSMFLDSPAVALVDDAMTAITSSVSVNNDSNFVVIDYVFPKFTKLYYDPVASSGDSTPATDSSSSLRSFAPTQSQASLTTVLAAVMLSALAAVLF